MPNPSQISDAMQFIDNLDSATQTNNTTEAIAGVGQIEAWISNNTSVITNSFAAFPFQKYGLVEHVSADSADANTGNGSNPADRAPAKNQPLVTLQAMQLRRMNDALS